MSDPAPTSGWSEFQQLAPTLYAWICLRVPDAIGGIVDRDDLFQEVACRVFAAWSESSTKTPPDDLRAWTFAVARNVMREELRRAACGGRSRARSSVWSALAIEATSIGQRAARREQLSEFLERVHFLGEEDRRLLTYRGFEELSFQEIGRALGIGEEAAKKRWQRLRERVRSGVFPIREL